MEAEYHHGADGDIDNELGFESVSAAPEVDDGEDGKETNDEIEGDVNEDITFIDMPIKEDVTYGQTRLLSCAMSLPSLSN